MSSINFWKLYFFIVSKSFLSLMAKITLLPSPTLITTVSVGCCATAKVVRMNVVKKIIVFFIFSLVERLLIFIFLEVEGEEFVFYFSHGSFAIFHFTSPLPNFFQSCTLCFVHCCLPLF